MSMKAFHPQTTMNKASKVFFMALVCLASAFFARGTFAASLKKVTGTPGESAYDSAVNQNFDRVNNELITTVHRASTETVTGQKYFTAPADFYSISVDTMTVTSGTISNATISSLTATSLSATVATISSATITTVGTNINMNSNKLTGLAAGTTAGDSVRFEQLPTVTAWASYTPTFTGFGTVANVQFFWRQVGDTIFIRGVFQSGTSTATSAKFTIPSGKTIDYTKCPSTVGNTAQAGVYFRSVTGGYGANSNVGPVFADGSDTDEIFFSGSGSTGNGLAKTNGSSLVAASDYITLEMNIPVS